jgi:hypothetical protein
MLFSMKLTCDYPDHCPEIYFMYLIIIRLILRFKDVDQRCDLRFGFPGACIIERHIALLRILYNPFAAEPSIN